LFFFLLFFLWVLWFVLVCVVGGVLVFFWVGGGVFGGGGGGGPKDRVDQSRRDLIEDCHPVLERQTLTRYDGAQVLLDVLLVLRAVRRGNADALYLGHGQDLPLAGVKECAGGPKGSHPVFDLDKQIEWRVRLDLKCLDVDLVIRYTLVSFAPSSHGLVLHNRYGCSSGAQIVPIASLYVYRTCGCLI